MAGILVRGAVVCTIHGPCRPVKRAGQLQGPFTLLKACVCILLVLSNLQSEEASSFVVQGRIIQVETRTSYVLEPGAKNGTDCLQWNSNKHCSELETHIRAINRQVREGHDIDVSLILRPGVHLVRVTSRKALHFSGGASKLVLAASPDATERPKVVFAIAPYLLGYFGRNSQLRMAKCSIIDPTKAMGPALMRFSGGGIVLMQGIEFRVHTSGNEYRLPLNFVSANSLRGLFIANCRFPDLRYNQRAVAVANPIGEVVISGSEFRVVERWIDKFQDQSVSALVFYETAGEEIVTGVHSGPTNILIHGCDFARQCSCKDYESGAPAAEQAMTRLQRREWITRPNLKENR